APMTSPPSPDGWPRKPCRHLRHPPLRCHPRCRCAAAGSPALRLAMQLAMQLAMRPTRRRRDADGRAAMIRLLLALLLIAAIAAGSVAALNLRDEDPVAELASADAANQAEGADPAVLERGRYLALAGNC